jgi:hypothetical protein
MSPVDHRQSRPHGAGFFGFHELGRGANPKTPRAWLGMDDPDKDLVGEAWDPEGNRVVISTDIWRGKVLMRHPALSPHLREVLRAIYAPNHILPDNRFKERRHHCLRGAGPSRWLIVVLSYEQEPVRLISAFPRRRDPDSWRK